jgi:CHAD domain-containing protein
VLLTRRATALKRHIAGAMDGHHRGVHQARVASRRLREAVPVLTTGVKGTKKNKALRKIRKLTQSLGLVRELDVTLQVLDEIAARDALPRLALEEVRAHAVGERDVRRADMDKRLARVNLPKLEKRLAAVSDALDASDSELWRAALGSRMVRRSKALAAAISEAGHMYAAEPLHQVRIAAKKLRYAMELAADAGIKSAAAPLRVVERAQDTLGRLHDFQVLQTHVAAVQSQPATGRTLPEGGLEIVARALEDECRHLHARYLASKPKLSEALATTRAVVVPQLTHQPRRTRPLKMTLRTRAVGRVAGEQR